MWRKGPETCPVRMAVYGTLTLRVPKPRVLPNRPRTLPRHLFLNILPGRRWCRCCLKKEEPLDRPVDLSPYDVVVWTLVTQEVVLPRLVPRTFPVVVDVCHPSSGRTGGGSSAVRPLASSLARILTLVGADSALGAPGVRVPGEWDDQQVARSNKFITEAYVDPASVQVLRRTCAVCRSAVHKETPKEA
ncbi:hypothetical protein HPB47_016827 [Ixodes persulcatus]|uniref:Uncharacterized protein n=1 Tax=Ixodes persulcatus TaxID=34615 RepID=A0AC60QQ21_IXOPE|nr:hypothetical protein HPB47_016827 [Ixodes persulcatus]